MAFSDNLFWRRLHSFTGAAPLGAYLLFHIYENSYSLLGPAGYNEHIRPLRQIPYLLQIEIIFIFTPLLYHSVYGVYIWATGKAIALQYGYARNWLYTAQRITGLLTFIFVYFHLYDQRLRPEASFENVAGSIAHPFVLWLYIIGVSAAAWHLFNGFWNVLIKWGVTVGKNAQRVALIIFSILGIGFVAEGLRALAGFIR